MSLVLNVIEGFRLTCPQCGGDDLTTVTRSAPQRLYGQIVFQCNRCVANNRPMTFRFAAVIVPLQDAAIRSTAADYGHYRQDCPA